MKAAAAKKMVKAAVAKKTVTASSSSKRCWSSSPSPPPSDSTLEAEFDLGSFSPKRKRKPVEGEVEDEDTETLAQRLAKRAKASTGDKPPVGTSHPSLADWEDIDTVIEKVSKDAEAEADKIAAEEAAKTATEEAAKGPTGEGADVKKAQEAAKEQAAKEEAARHQHHALLNSQEENLVTREEALAATLRGKDEDVEKLLLSEANDSINNLKLKLDGLEGKFSEAEACEETLNKILEDEKQLRRNGAAEHEEYAKGVNLWISRLVDVAGRITPWGCRMSGTPRSLM
nr:uncharacterized protein CG45076-like [Aegilops tauschii subsp. strangulata]